MAPSIGQWARLNGSTPSSVTCLTKNSGQGYTGNNQLKYFWINVCLFNEPHANLSNKMATSES